MRLIAHHRSFFDWKLKSVRDVKPGEVALPSVHGEDFRHVQVVYSHPNTTEIVIPDADIERMYEDHEEARRNGATGYTTKQVGGPNDGKTVTVAPRTIPKLSRGELIARHLTMSVFPFHFPLEDLTKIEVMPEPPASPDGKKLDADKLAEHRKASAAMEKFLSRRLLPESGE